MSIGKMIAQACHAAVEANELGKKLNHKVWRRWRGEGSKKVALKVDSKEELEEIANQAEELEIVNILIKDAGLTEVPPGSITALGIGPDESDKIDRVTGSLPLIK
jgi:PTH2 family peptidyl-tRNA hydrolase